MAGVLGVNVYDSALSLGNPTARTSGLLHDPVSRNKIVDLVDKDTVTQFFWARDGDKKVPAFTGMSEGEPVTYMYSTKQNCWLLTETQILTPAVVASGMAAELKRLREEVHKYKIELATEQLNVSLLRHEVERLRQKVDPPARPRFTYLQKFIFGLLLGLVAFNLLPGAAAQNTTLSSTPSFFELNLDIECRMQMFQDWLVTKIVEFDIRNIDFKILVHYAFKIWSHWLFHLVTFLTMAYIRYTNVTPALAFGFLSVWSRWHANAFLPLSMLDDSCLLIYGTTLFLYPLSVPLAFLGLCLLSGGYVVACIAAGAVNTDTALAGTYSVFVMFGINVLCETIGIPRIVPSLLYVAFRSVSFIIKRPAQVIVKDAEGKTVETHTLPPKQSAFTRFSQFLRKFRQKTLRTGVSTMFQVPSEATVHVRTSLGTLTGFRVANFIVTAKHGFDENDVCEIEHQGRVHASKIKYRHPGKDIVFLTLPSGLQDLKPFKMAKDYGNGPVAVIAKSGEFVTFATAEGVVVGDEITYAVSTADGTSGAPVVTPAGKVVGLHVINTGFSAGAVRFTPDDFPPTETKMNAKVKALEEEIRRLKAEKETTQEFEQCSAEEVIHLIREAVQKEIKVIRAELKAILEEGSDEETDVEEEAAFEQAKGKTKKGKTWRRNATHNRTHGEKSKAGKQERKKRVWTEEEYKKLQEEGYSVEDLKKMADEIREQQEQELNYATTLGEDAGTGYPDFEDPGSEYEEEVNNEWFKQNYMKPEEPPKPKKSFKQFWDENYKEPAPGITAVHFLEKYDTPMDEDMKSKFTTELKKLLHRLDVIKENAIRDSKWVPTVDVRKVLDDVSAIWYDVNYQLWEMGVENFLQKKSKNSRKARASQGRKSTQ
nr:MAG: ORF1a protein [Jingmen bat astrovirus 8]WOK58293.1 MAG: ORF1a protein [Jingmen bat astrovirus 8]